jgi:hypothetical protein
VRPAGNEIAAVLFDLDGVLRTFPTNDSWAPVDPRLLTDELRAAGVID